MPDVSVIIPCFNHGQYINEAIDSVLNQTHRDFEIIVVDDGSTDPRTIQILNKINHPKIKVLHTNNQGLASARNNGIIAAQADIILPLDSDDKIEPGYIEKALRILNGDPSVGIVYCYTNFFEEKRGKWLLPEYSLKKMLFENLIFACAFFRRADWKTVKGYNPNMKYGWEDWDFWLSIISLGRKVIRIPEALHRYRIRGQSMGHVMTISQQAAMHAQLFLNHQDLYKTNLPIFFEEVYELKFLYHRPIASRMLGNKWLKPFIRKLLIF